MTNLFTKFSTSAFMLLLGVTSVLKAEEPSKSFLDMSLEELMNVKTTVASKKGVSLRESPGILTVISNEEIKNSGARDMIDLLRLVAGIDFGMDVQGVVGISIRGNWGHEGKVLLMIDGLTANELSYSSTQFGNHYSVENIDHIEIIRGPGSSIYGGFAELGVINIITKTGKDLRGVSASANYGQMEKDFGRLNLNLSAGNSIDDFEYCLHAFYGKSNRSDRTFTDIYGTTKDLSNDGSVLNPYSLNASIKYKDLSARVYYEDYYSKSFSSFDAAADTQMDLRFKSILSEIKYDWKINDQLTISPKVNYTFQKPWLSYSKDYSYQLNASGINSELLASYDFNDNVNVIAGIGYFSDDSKYENDNTFYNGKNTFSYNNVSAFAQCLFNTEYANITLGGRFDKHSEVDAAFSPRIAITKAFDKFHYKLLYSHAFRSPGIENMNSAYQIRPDGSGYTFSAPNIKPEKTRVAELELGYNLSSDMTVGINLFHTTILDPILYFFFVDSEENINEGYYNGKQAGSKGVELDFRVRENWGYVNVNYSYYTASGINEVATYSVPGKDGSLLAFPQHKVVIYGSYKITENLSINPNLIFRSTRYSYRKIDIMGNTIINEEKPITLLNLFLNYNNFLFNNLSLGVGIYDALGMNDEFIQPYNGKHAPYLGASREIGIKLNYYVGFEE